MPLISFGYQVCRLNLQKGHFLWPFFVLSQIAKGIKTENPPGALIKSGSVAGMVVTKILGFIQFKTRNDLNSYHGIKTVDE